MAIFVSFAAQMERSKGILSWSEEERPREKLVSKGERSLTNSELLAIIIGSGTLQSSAVDVSRDILKLVDNNLEKLGQLSLKDLCKINGIGNAKAISIIAALEIGRRRNSTSSATVVKITSSQDVYNLLFADLADLNHEEFWLVILNRNNQVLNKKQISSGGVSATVVDPKIIFKSALDKLGSSVVLAHNHPSGNLNPSNSDKKLTSKLKSAGENLEIPVLDHIIFTNNAYFSFADEGIL